MQGVRRAHLGGDSVAETSQVTPPDAQEVASFIDAARRSGVIQEIEADTETRWIGLDEETTEQIIELIRAGDKTGTFSLPWIIERTGQRSPVAGQHIVLVDMNGRPRLLVRLTVVREAIFGQVDATHTAVDGTPVRDPTVWKPLHEQYWGALLAPHGLHVSDDMPFLIEEFELVYDAG